MCSVLVLAHTLCIYTYCTQTLLKRNENIFRLVEIEFDYMANIINHEPSTIWNRIHSIWYFTGKALTGEHQIWSYTSNGSWCLGLKQQTEGNSILFYFVARGRLKKCFLVSNATYFGNEILFISPDMLQIFIKELFDIIFSTSVLFLTNIKLKRKENNISENRHKWT